MNTKSGTQTFQSLLQNFFLQRMIQQRKVSGQTVNSYRDTFRIYLVYLSRYYRISAASVRMEHVDRDYILQFCKYLEEIRHNKAATINNRLAALHAFLQYVAEVAPEYSAIASRALSVPFQKQEVATMDFITKYEFNIMISCCCTSTFLGARDKLMLMILFNTGVRVSELLGLKYDDIKDADIPNRTCIRVNGKGRKERIVPLWKTTAIYLQKFIKSYGLSSGDCLFKGKNGEDLTRSGIRFRINNIVRKASSSASTLLEKNISVHTFRHSVAMNLLAAGVDISTIAIWLCHSSIETTHKYMIADVEMKRKAMEKAGASGNAFYRYNPSPDILGFLNSL